ncbi:MAG: porphobilinogen synthase [Flavobacteriales bacterium]|nr:MAG: porphobilinogen synthase [Flavobacteriales bacterium]
MNIRPRRLRKNPIIRELIAETRLSKDMFVYPHFVVGGKGVKEPINAMPGIHHFSVDELLKDVEIGMKLGINKVLLFGVGEEKSEDASTSYDSNSIVSLAVSALKEKFVNDLYIITDVCVCAYTTHGHCGIVHDSYVDNDKSVEVLAKMALAHAKAGADMIAPSDMMDGRVGAIRQTLDDSGFENTAIMSYTIKFASAYYGPFREAADSAPEFGDRKSYQMDFRNKREAMKEAELDELEGADILMIKPALAYLDVISELRQQTNLPVACYNVSGEYSMVKAAAEKGLIDEQKIVMENMYAFSRAGADIIITYHIREILEKGWL